MSLAVIGFCTSVAYVLITAAGTDTLHLEYIDICALFAIYSERYIDTAGDGCSLDFIVSLRGTYITDEIAYNGVIYTMHILMNNDKFSQPVMKTENFRIFFTSVQVHFILCKLIHKQRLTQFLY